MTKMAKWLNFAKINLLTAMMLLVSAIGFSQNVNVTFRINTAGVPDTLISTSTVQVRGGTAPLTWGLDSPVLAHNVGGDYWEATASFPKNSEIVYKFFTNAKPVASADGGQGWEGDLEGDGNRHFWTLSSDTVLAVEWVNGWNPNHPDKKDRPLSKTDSIDVYFRVNMEGMIEQSGFNPVTQMVGVRGDDMGLTNPPISWGTTVPLMPEVQHPNGGSRQYQSSNFYSASIRFPVSKLGSTAAYKFVIANAGDFSGVTKWEDGDNKTFILNADTSLGYKYFNNVKPTGTVCEDCDKDVHVTFLINTAGVPDTLNMLSTVQVRGGTAPLTWGLDSPVLATNIGGDYWMAQATFKAHSNISYKFYTNSNPRLTLTAEQEGQGWEADVADGNRALALGANDTVIQVQWVNGWNDKKPAQYARPLSTTDSIDVYFRVNMEAQIELSKFDPETQSVGVRGDDMGLTNPPINWGSTFFLTKENPHANSGSQQYNAGNFYSGSVRFPASKLGATAQYKFVIEDNATPGTVTTWEDGNNKTFPLNSDTSIAYIFFNNVKPAGSCLTCNSDVTLNFTVDMDKAITNNGFFLETDTLYVQVGLNSTTLELAKVKLDNTGGTIFEGTANVKADISKPIQYGYFRVFKNTQDVTTELKEFYFDNYDPVAGNNQENRKILATGATVEVDDTAPDNTSSHRSPFFKNTSTMAQATKIILEVDYRPALNEVKKWGASLVDGQNAQFIVDATNIDQFPVYVNGPLTRNVDNNDWGSWNAAGLTDGRKMVDDGTGDDSVAGDSIWTISFNWATDNDNAFVSQVFKFGINGGDNEAGYGNNHMYNVKAGQAVQRIRAAFGDIQPLRYPHWDYPNARPLVPNSVVDNLKANDFDLGQNYPNPFNPSTVIPFSVPKAGVVRLEIFNMLGQKVLEFTENISSPGVYKRTVDASQLTSGTYLYKMTSGSFTKTNKMTLVK